MIVDLILSILIAAVLPQPNPAPSAAPVKTLQVIANVRSTPRCAEIVTHANSAISTALNNDLVLGQTITRLRFVNLDDGNPIHRRNGLAALGDLAKTLTQQARSADDEVKRLRSMAADSTDPVEKKELKEFADELGGALWRQQKIARDLNGYLAAVDFQDMAKFDEGEQQANMAVFGVPDPLAETPPMITGGRTTYTPPGTPTIAPNPLGHDPNHATATEQAHAAANDFQLRLPEITTDENDAATHVAPALSHC